MPTAAPQAPPPDPRGVPQDWLLDAADWNWRLPSERSGASRAIGDIGSHWMDLLQHVGRRIARVYAQLGSCAKRLRPARRRPSTVAAAGGGAGRRRYRGLRRFELDDGCRALFHWRVTPGKRNGLTFEIDAGAVSLAWSRSTRTPASSDRPNEVLVHPELLSPAAAALAHYPRHEG